MIDPSFNKQTTLPDLTSSISKSMTCPKQIGPYKIESMLNKGGMSLLFLGTQEHTSKPIVIKVLSPKYVQNKEMVDRFLKEAQIIGMTNHPNIIKLYGQGKWEKGLYIAMEFIQGVSLRQFILQKSLSQKRALEIILQVAYALCHLHTHGVIHRDLKPENILITESGEIKVVDFGIAQLHDETKEHIAISQKKRLIGTPIYMSPEQKDSPNSVSFASDIFSLGIITYELVLGRLSHGVIQLSLLPKGLQPIVSKALKIDPKNRYQDIVDFITDISQYIQHTREEKEIDKEEEIEEIIDNLHQTQNLLFTTTPPTLPQLEIGIAHKEGLSLTGLYLDFFHLPNNYYIIVLAEPVKTGVHSLIPTANLRGMIKLGIQEASNNKIIELSSFLKSINQTISSDSIKDPFAFNFLLLNQEKNFLTFVSCGHNQLWQNSESSKKIVSLSTPNNVIGENLQANIVEATTNWSFGDKLILFSLGCVEEHQKKINVKTIIAENINLSAKKQSKNILEKIISLSDLSSSDRIPAVITIHRVY